MELVACPRCGTQVPQLQNIDPALASKIQAANPDENVPSQVCPSCFTDLAGGVARGSILMAREKAKEQKKLTLWKSRVNILKKARQNMADKMFSDAAVSYEKYLRVLEVVYDTEPGKLSPEMFKDSARTQELTIVTGVYWDLLRIYDTSERYNERMMQTAEKLAQFLKFTPIFPDIIRKAESFAKTAKNPTAVKHFLKLAVENKGRCFIATAAFENEFAPEVIRLRMFRDFYLQKSFGGRFFIKLYYALSPSIAFFIDRMPSVKPLIRRVLQQISRRL